MSDHESSDHESHSDDALDPILTGFGVLAVVAGLTLTAVLMAGRPKYDHADLRTVTELKLKQRDAIANDPAWVDKEKGIVSLPVSRAAELVVSEVQRDPGAATAAEALPVATLAAGGAAAGLPVAAGAGAAAVGGDAPAATLPPSDLAPVQAPAEDAPKAKKKAAAHKGAPKVPAHKPVAAKPGVTPKAGAPAMAPAAAPH